LQDQYESGALRKRNEPNFKHRYKRIGSSPPPPSYYSNILHYSAQSPPKQIANGRSIGERFVREIRFAGFENEISAGARSALGALDSSKRSLSALHQIIRETGCTGIGSKARFRESEERRETFNGEDRERSASALDVDRLN